MFRSQAHWWFVALAVLIAVPFEAFPVDPPLPRPNPILAPLDTAKLLVRDEQQLAERKLLQEALPRTRKAETLLRSARQQFDRGEASAGLMTLQQLLNQPQDTFVWSATSVRPNGVRSQVVALLEALPASALQRYEELFGAEAGRLLAKARRDGNPQLLDEISRRFFLTAEGYDATVLLAAWWLDHGAPARSAAHWDQLFSTPSHQKRIEAAQRMQAAIAFARCGRAEDAQRIAGNLGPEPVAGVRRGASFEQWLQTRVATADATSLAIGGLVAGAPHRNGIATGTAPVFSTPAWSAPLWRDANDELRPVLTAWEQELANDNGPGAISQFALCIGDAVVFRDVQGLRAVDVTTGKMLWHTPTLTSLSSLKFYHRTPTARGPNKFDLKFLDQLLGDNSAAGMLSSDGSRVYAVDQLDWKQATRQANSLIAVDVSASRLEAGGGRLEDGGSKIASKKSVDPPSSILDPRPLRWRIGGPVVEDATSTPPLAGHFFLGPPLPVDGLLFALTEFDQQVKLNCLLPHSGDVLWSQTIAITALPVSASESEKRFYRAYSLASADGVVVCPTPAGLLVAVDTLTGALLWAQPCDDVETRQERLRGMQSIGPRPDISNAAIVNLPLISGGRVIYLPSQSTRLQCFDLRTGDRLWQSYREEQDSSSEHVATATDDVVLVVGRRCRALRLDTGAEAWSVRFDSWPCGRGVRVGSHFLVPLTRGALSQLDLTSGRQVGLIELPPDQRPGNLVVHRDAVVSMSPVQATAFPRAEPLRKRLLAEVALAPAGSATPDQILRLATLDSLNGLHSDAYRRLNELLSQKLTGAQRQTAETSLRNVLFAATSPEQLALWQSKQGERHGDTETRRHGADPIPGVSASPRLPLSVSPVGATPPAVAAELSVDRWFDLLDQWSADRAPEERLEALMRRAAWENSRSGWMNLADVSRKIADLDIRTPWSPPDDPARRVSAVRWLADRVARQQSKLDDESLVGLLAQWDADLDRATQAADPLPLKQLLAAAGGWPQAEVARTRLAARWQDLGQPQVAELLLLENRRRGTPGTAGEATRLLVELWSEEGLYDPAARLLRDLDTRFADVPLDGGRTGRDYVARFPRDSLTWAAFRRLIPREWPTANIVIREERWYDDQLHQTYNASRLLALPPSSPFDLFDRGRSGGSELVVVDRVSGAERGKFPITAGYSHALSPLQLDSGQLVPLGAQGAMQGVSLMEGRVIWTTSPGGRYDRDTVARVGPSGADFCSFQSDSHLFVLNPTNGQVLWQRNDLEPSSGLVADTYSGLFGDSDVLTVFAKDRATYTLFRTSTGEEISRGRLDINPAMTRRVSGRRLLHFTESEDQRRLRLWDPRSDRWLVDEPVASLLNGQTRPFRIPRGQPASTLPCILMTADDLILITSDGRLRIFDLHRDEWTVDLQLPPHLTAGVESLRSFRDHERYYISLLPSASGQDQSPTQFFASDVMVPVTHLHGTLIAVSRPGGSRIQLRAPEAGRDPSPPTPLPKGERGEINAARLLWEQRVQPCSILQVSDPPLPFLIVLCREKTGNQLSLRIELRDVTSGDVIVGADQLYPDRIVQFSADPDQRLIELIGSKSTVRLEFSKE